MDNSVSKINGNISTNKNSNNEQVKKKAKKKTKAFSGTPSANSPDNYKKANKKDSTLDFRKAFILHSKSQSQTNEQAIYQSNMRLNQHSLRRENLRNQLSEINSGSHPQLASLKAGMEDAQKTYDEMCDESKNPLVKLVKSKQDECDNAIADDEANISSTKEQIGSLGKQKSQFEQNVRTYVGKVDNLEKVLREVQTDAAKEGLDDETIAILKERVYEIKNELNEAKKALNENRELLKNCEKDIATAEAALKEHEASKQAHEEDKEKLGKWMDLVANKQIEEARQNVETAKQAYESAKANLEKQIQEEIKECDDGIALEQNNIKIYQKEAEREKNKETIDKIKEKNKANGKKDANKAEKPEQKSPQDKQLEEQRRILQEEIEKQKKLKEEQEKKEIEDRLEEQRRIVLEELKKEQFEDIDKHKLTFDDKPRTVLY